MPSDPAHTLARIVREPIALDRNYASLIDASQAENQQQTNEVFSEKWDKYESAEDLGTFYAFRRNWYLKLYGFEREDALRQHLAGVDTILDAGCGLGYKAASFADLAPHALVVGIDFSAAAAQAARLFADRPNLVFLRGDISQTPFEGGAVRYVSCDQLIIDNEDPEATFAELSRITAVEGKFVCYFNAMKALPRELLDDYFRTPLQGSDPRSALGVVRAAHRTRQAAVGPRGDFRPSRYPIVGDQGGANRHPALHLLELPQVPLEPGPWVGHFSGYQFPLVQPEQRAALQRGRGPCDRGRQRDGADLFPRRGGGLFGRFRHRR